jgi:hypothetical protein
VLLISCDPGLRVLGLAVFYKGDLVHAELVKNPVLKARGPEAWWGMATAARLKLKDGWLAPDMYVVEVPQVYRFGGASTDPDDLIQLAGIGGAVGSIIKPTSARGYYPRQWKGQVPKEIMIKRIETKLASQEVAAIVKCPPSLRHNVVDAIGIGLFHLGRLGKPTTSA